MGQRTIDEKRRNQHHGDDDGDDRPLTIKAPLCLPTKLPSFSTLATAFDGHFIGS